jgi:hypothetical protein
MVENSARRSDASFRKVTRSGRRAILPPLSYRPFCMLYRICEHHESMDFDR